MVKVSWDGDSVPHSRTQILCIMYVSVWISCQGEYIVHSPKIGTGAKYLALLITHDLLVVYMVLSHEQNKQRSSKMKRLFKGHSPKALKLQSERKGCLRTLKYRVHASLLPRD